MMKLSFVVALGVGLFFGLFAAETVVEENFAADLAGKTPKNWKLYSAKAKPESVQIIGHGEGKALKIDDDSEKTETGVYRDFPVKENLHYRATVECGALEGRKLAGSYLQIRFLPSDTFKQIALSGETELAVQAPPGTEKLRLYVYTHFQPTPGFVVESIKLEESPEPFSPPGTDTLIKSRDLVIETALVKSGRPAARIVTAPKFKPLADRINAAVKRKTGVELPVDSDSLHRDVKKLESNLILLGNRDDNETIQKFYMLYYTLLDALHPGEHGNELRSLHNPFGDRFNVIFAGGSRDAGTAAAVEKLLLAIQAAPGDNKTLQLPYLLDVTLDPATARAIPANTDDTSFWGFSRGYGKRGYYGWNSLSKNMALFYITGDTRYAQEFLRLAFPTEEVAKELLKRDDEAYWDPKRPLSTPYHYRSIYMILYWDLIEEHPFFSDEQRLAVTRELYGQFKSNAEGEFNILRENSSPRPVAENRHATWEALSLYTIGRYFDKYYPDRISRKSLQTAADLFDSIGKYMAMDYGSLFWYNTYIEPVISYAILSDGRKFENNPAIRDYGEALLMLSNGATPDWSDSFSALNMLTKLAFLTRDEAFMEQIRMLKVDPKEFRLGQSWWPREPFPRNFYVESAGRFVRPNLRTDLLNSFRVRPAHVPLERIAHFLSYREKADNSGDFLLVDTKYESGRHPFHNFAILELALAARPTLRGHSNQLSFYRNGIATGNKSFITDLRAYGKVGSNAFVDGKIYDFNGHDWERFILLHNGGYLLTLDTVIPTSDMADSTTQSTWEGRQSAKPVATPAGEAEFSRGDYRFLVSCSSPAELEIVEVAASSGSAGSAARFSFNRAAKAGEASWFVTLVRPGRAGEQPVTAQEGDVVALRLPQPALLRRQGNGFILTTADSLFGYGVSEIPGLFKQDAPVAFDFDAKSGLLTIRDAEGRISSGKAGSFRLPSAAELEAEVSRIIAARPKFAAPEIKAAELLPAWKFQADGFAGAIHSFRRGNNSYFLLGAGQTAYLCDFSGRILHKFAMDATVGAVYYWPETELLLVGCKDEKLAAFGFDGKKKWEVVSQMAQELIDSVKFYWFKDAIPGITYLTSASLEPGRSLLYAGSAGTVEVIDPNGKVLKRFWQTWGAVSGSAFVPATEKTPAELRFYRHMGGNPDVFALRSDGKGGVLQVALGLSNDQAGVFMGGYGFSMVGRYGMAAGRFGLELKTVEGLNGVHNRLIIRKPDGRIEHELDLGPGFLATGSDKSNYGREAVRKRNIRGLELADLDGDGQPEIILAMDRKFIAAFDGKLELRFLTRLPAGPVRLTVIPGSSPVFAAGCFDGRVFLLDRDGRISHILPVKGIPVAMTAVEGQLVVGSDSGEISGFRLP